MDNIEELLPGIEEFLTGTLGSESLSSFAEERRQFFLERLDIVKLPPSIPPREGRSLPPELLKETEEISGMPACSRVPDFAATQREISRSFLDSATSDDRTTNGSSIGKAVKVYDDIDQTDSQQKQDYSRQRAASQASTTTSVENGDENGVYEIPLSRPQFCTDDNSLDNFGTEGSSMGTMGSTKELHDGVSEARTVSPPCISIPRFSRNDIKFSDSESRDSLEGDNRPPELPFRPPLPKRNEICSTNDKSDRSETEKSVTSDPDLSGEGDSTSYESFEDDNDYPDNDRTNTFQVKLPKKPQKKSSLRRSRKHEKSCSPSRWEINVPFRKLSNIDISGELLHKGKLKWNRRICAISDSCLVIYKPEINSRPLLVVPLAGYEASVSEREGKKGFEVKMMHPKDDSHTFSVDFKEWALHWIEHINGNSKKQPPAKYHTHLARSYSEDADCGLSVTLDGSKNDLTGSNSNVSTEGGSQDRSKDKAKRKKIMRLGSFAFRASQFFDGIGKRTAGGRKAQGSSVSGFRHSSGDTIEVSSCAVQSSISADNLTKKLRSPASDSSTTSVFSESNRGSSLPPTPCNMNWPTGKPWEADDVDETVHVTYKGHLSIYSSFNKRCWGRRWCQVRENMFECYKTDSSQHCELRFQLRPCVLRRAMVETNSDNGLMILEAGREKITVETLSKDEMGQWVRVLYKETTNDGIPEGLEDFLEHKEDYGPYDVNSFFPGRNLSSHDYEDPEETVAAAARLKAGIQDKCETSFLHTIDQADNESLLSLKDVQNLTKDSMPLSLTCKQITDSGFYSVRGTNSDSDSSCEITAPLLGKIDYCLSTAGSQHWDNLDYSMSSSKFAVDSIQNRRNVSLLSKALVCKDLPNQNVPSLPSESCQSLPSPISPRLSKPSSGMPNHHDEFTRIHPQKGVIPERNSTVASTVSSTSSHEAVILSPGDDYSIILKRSERLSKVHSLSAVPSSTKPSNSPCMTSDTLPEDVFEESDKNKSPDSRNTSSQEHLISLANSGAESAFCEPAGKHVKTTLKVTQSTNILNNYLTGSSDAQPPPLPSSPVPKLRTDKSKGTLSPHSDGRKVEPDHISLHARLPRKVQQKPAANDGLLVPSKLEEITPITCTEGDDPSSPTSDNISALISRASTTPVEIMQVIDSFKIRQAVNKRRRMAVHDKRQRVLSDEDRLACEKEFAALEKAGESIEMNIRVLQNHLDIIQGQTMQAMKASHLKGTPESKKKGKSRKTFSKVDRR